jgi:two-component system, cell cycle sensor histidine kinase and response regulator CckA
MSPHSGCGEQMGERTVLLVDDDSDVREILNSALSLSFHVLVAANAAEAIDIMAHRQVDLLLTDIVMPDMDGLDLADRATALRPGLPVVYMTGYSDQARNSARRLHGTLLLKPFRPMTLVETIKSALSA